MKKTYTQEKVNALLLNDSLNRVIRMAVDLKDDAYTQGFGEGYTKGKQEAREESITVNNKTEKDFLKMSQEEQSNNLEWDKADEDEDDDLDDKKFKLAMANNEINFLKNIILKLKKNNEENTAKLVDEKAI